MLVYSCKSKIDMVLALDRLPAPSNSSCIQAHICTQNAFQSPPRSTNSHISPEPDEVLLLPVHTNSIDHLLLRLLRLFLTCAPRFPLPPVESAVFGTLRAVSRMGFPAFVVRPLVPMVSAPFRFWSSFGARGFAEATAHGFCGLDGSCWFG